MNAAHLSAIGIDWKTGLARCTQNAALYERLLRRFITDGNARKASEAFAAEDYEGAYDALHTLKGTSGIIGMTSVFRLSSDMLNRLREKEYKELPRYFTELISLCDAAATAIRTATDAD